MKEDLHLSVEGHVKIWDPNTQEVFVDKRNAINAEVVSDLIAQAFAKEQYYYIFEMHFGNGGAIIDENGNITYRDVYTNLDSGYQAGLFSPTYFKVVDETNTSDNDDPSRNNVISYHTEGLNYSDVVITCTLEGNQPNLAETTRNLAGVPQQSYDSATNFDGDFIFNEIGLKCNGPSGDLNMGHLMTHIVFHPVQKSANRVIQVVYTLRIRIV